MWGCSHWGLIALLSVQIRTLDQIIGIVLNRNGGNLDYGSPTKLPIKNRAYNQSTMKKLSKLTKIYANIRRQIR